jgi:hypothetical protein
MYSGSGPVVGDELLPVFAVHVDPACSDVPVAPE